MASSDTEEQEWAVTRADPPDLPPDNPRQFHQQRTGTALFNGRGIARPYRNPPFRRLGREQGSGFLRADQRPTVSSNAGTVSPDIRPCSYRLSNEIRRAQGAFGLLSRRVAACSLRRDSCASIAGCGQSCAKRPRLQHPSYPGMSDYSANV